MTTIFVSDIDTCIDTISKLRTDFWSNSFQSSMGWVLKVGPAGLRYISSEHCYGNSGGMMLTHAPAMRKHFNPNLPPACRAASAQASARCALCEALEAKLRPDTAAGRLRPS